ncbi:MAG: squalene synthase HpnC [Planctomycetia bacterium]|nr:squalene synthase HpnC [Planctomycetia bacterium]
MKPGSDAADAATVGGQAARRDPAAWRLAEVPTTTDLAVAQAFCREVARRHYENFTVATRLVPPRLRQHLATVYAFARWSDDLADEAADPAEAIASLAAWRHELEECFAGRPRHPVMVAVAHTARQTGLAIEPFADLLDAFEQDQRKTRYETRAELVDYCRRSADPVGRIVLALEGCRDPQLVTMSDSICTGLQLVNFWQDLRRDRLAGRVYLPQEDLRRHGIGEEELDACTSSVALRRLLADEVAWARECFAAGAPLAERGPPVLRPAIAMFLGGGRAVADAIEKAGFDTLVRRPTVGRWTKLNLAARGWWATRRSGS